MIKQNFMFPSQLMARLKAAKAKTGWNLSEIVRRALDEWLKKEEL